MRVLNNALTLVMACLLNSVSAVSAETEFGSLPETFPDSTGFPMPVSTDFEPSYPEWPDRFIRSDIIPPPPGGPYMSSAMSGIDAFPADSGGLRSEYRQQQPDSLFDANMPWPETPERERPQPWVPETGEYRYVPEEIVRQLETPAFNVRQQRPPFQPYPGYPPAPAMRQPYYGYR